MPQKVSFQVAHVSGQDDQYKANELNTHGPLTKGWQSARFCLYPQDLVIKMDERTRLRKIQILAHQHLIPTKIEFYVGDVPDDSSVNLTNARYTRLGYIQLSDNEKTGYQARELKSVHVDAVGLYLKLVIHKNHINRHNLYNQVGLVAVNIIGDDVQQKNDNEYLSDERFKEDPVLAGVLHKPDYISPLDDLAFDMYLDPEVADIIRRLERKKQEAVIQERYDYAKKIKQAVTDLQKVGEKLGKYEVEKRQAIEAEDYDKAKLKKVQMDDYRLQVYTQIRLSDLLETELPARSSPAIHEYDPYSPPSRAPVSDPVPLRQPTPPRLEALTNRPPPPPTPPIHEDFPEPPRTPYDERVLPALRKAPPQPADEAPLREDLDDDAAADTNPGGGGGGGVGGAGDGAQEAGMSEKDQRDASLPIDVFGLPVVTKAYSKNWSHREDALTSLHRQLQNGPAQNARDDFKAAVFMCKRGINDQVFAVFQASLRLLKMLLTEYVPSQKLGRADVTYALDRTLPDLLHKSGDTAIRNRDTAKQFIVEMSQFPEVAPLHYVPHECVKPFKLSLAPRLAQSRTELVHMLHERLGRNNTGLTVDNIMRFCANALHHTNPDVRQSASRTIIELYTQVDAPSRDLVREHLPPDDEKTRKNVLYKDLFEAFDRLDGKPSKADMKRQKAEAEQAKQKEIEALQKQLQQLKDINAGKAPVDPKVLAAASGAGAASGGGGGGSGPSTSRTQKGKKPDAKKKKDEVATSTNLDRTCIFCGEQNEAFTDDGLDIHYWKECPMLKRCENCKQVVEISSYTEHLLTECVASDKYKKCPRCTEAIPRDQYDKHVKDKLCNAAEGNKAHCSLCHQNITPGEDGWKQHLMGKDGCRNNPRRIQALNKLPQGGRGRGAGRGGAAAGRRR